MPSFAALGPNSYLTRADFFKMLGAALAVHLFIFAIAAFFPHEKVTNIPVRALSFKLGDQDRIAALAPAPASTVRPSAPTMHAFGNPVSARVSYTPPIAKSAPVVKPVPAKPTKIAPLPVVQTAPAIAPAPQQYVREVGQPTPQLAPLPATAGTYAAPTGIATGMTNGASAQTMQSEQTAREIRDRYEQQISGWIERHKYYPPDAGGRAGRVVIRMRIDRAGAIRYYALEQSSGIAAIDAAAIDMVRRANPVPAVPENYPAGNLVEFLIPIGFSVPR